MTRTRHCEAAQPPKQSRCLRLGALFRITSVGRQRWAQACYDMRSIPYAVYILTNHRRTVLYTGVTNNLVRRIAEHRQRSRLSFARRYHAHTLVYVEWFREIEPAIAREKQIKAGSRARKVALIEGMNREWKDLGPLLGIESQEGEGGPDCT